MQANKMIRPILSLLFVCAVMSALVAFTYGLCTPIIEARRASEDPKREIFPDATFERVEVDSDMEVYNAGDGAYIVLTKAKGYNKSDPMEVMIGFADDGTIAKIVMVTNKETEGLGSQLGEETFLNSFAGKENADGIDAISGATVSSKAFFEAVNRAKELVDQVKGA